VCTTVVIAEYMHVVSYEAFVSVQEDLEEEEYPEGFKLTGSVPDAAQEPDQNQDKAAAGMLRNITFALTEWSISADSNLPSFLFCCIVAEAVLPMACPCPRARHFLMHNWHNLPSQADSVHDQA